MRISFKDSCLTEFERKEIKQLIERKSENLKTDLEEMWFLMDLVWDDFRCDNRNLLLGNIDGFYSHPVWLLNGLFIEQDDTSMGHRYAISEWVSKNKFIKVVDYGGGFGTLARLVATSNRQAIVDIYEPHPSEFGVKRMKEFQNINIVDVLGEQYECLLSTDVLEHVPDPLADFSKMIDSVKVGGYLVIANCFFPVIKCHLPQNFHFRFTFNLFAKMMGLEVKGLLEGSHATIFKKVENKQVSWWIIRQMEVVSRVCFPLISFLSPVLRPIKKALSE
ncbi:MAG: methyltransferase domain-containing protein [Cycloclasticus sp.]|nr:methyltransferase domain-containing protein [Cycloclasticus sp.]